MKTDPTFRSFIVTTILGSSLFVVAVLALLSYLGVQQQLQKLLSWFDAQGPWGPIFFVVTSLGRGHYGAKRLYEEIYCARGEMENCIKEQLSLFAERVSTTTMRANQLRMYLSGFAYTLFIAFRRLALEGTELARAQVNTLRLKLLKIGATVKISVRRVMIALSSSCPYQELFAHAYAKLLL